MIRMLWMPLMLLLSLYMAGCATQKIQAPFDGFVCFSQSIQKCMTNPRTKDLKKYYGQTFPQKRLFFTFEDKSGGQEEETKDGVYKCKLGTLSYKPTLNPDKTFDIVFVSPVLLSQLAEQEIRLERARDACKRLIKGYDFNLDFIAKQTEAAKVSIGVTKLAAETEAQRLGKEDIGSRPTRPEEADALNAPRYKILRDTLWVMRQRGAELNEEVRTKANEQTLSIEYKGLFEDANSLIESQLRELGRQLFVLDRSVVSSDGPSKYVGYDNGSWVQKGTIVLEVRRNNHE